MTEGTTPKRLSCIPCARRKIRCDRTEPCSHCVRKGEFCDFPLPRAKKQAKDPSRPKENHGQSNRTPLDGWPGWGSPPTPASLASGRLESDHGTKRSSDGTPVVYETLRKYSPTLDLRWYDVLFVPRKAEVRRAYFQLLVLPIHGYGVSVVPLKVGLHRACLYLFDLRIHRHGVPLRRC